MLDDICRTAAVLQDFAIGRERPETVIAALAGLCGADKGFLIAYSGTVDGARPFAVLNAAPEGMQQYSEWWALRDVQAQALVRKYGASPPPVLIDEDVLPYADFKRSEIFNDFYRPADVHRLIRVTGGEPYAGGQHMGVLLAGRARADSTRNSGAPLMRLHCSFILRSPTSSSAAARRMPPWLPRSRTPPTPWPSSIRTGACAMPTLPSTPFGT